MEKGRVISENVKTKITAPEAILRQYTFSSWESREHQTAVAHSLSTFLYINSLV
jgi:hypothetical protein